MPFAVTTFAHVRLLTAVVCCALMAGQGRAAPAQIVPDVNAPTAARVWPRVFYQADERANIVSRRQAMGDEAAPLAGVAPGSTAPTYKLEGLSQGRKGATAWINGQMLRQGELHAGGRTVLIGRDVVRLRLAGQPDIVLRPGQQADETGEMLQDVVPSGSLRKR
jgi:hypothetical protein